MHRVLLCLDSDPQPSVFDAITAIDAEVDHLLRHGGVRPEDVRPLVYGAMFTRGGSQLKNTAIFIGGSDIAAGETLLKAATATFFDSTRVSAMLDSNGANTTAAAAVLATSRHIGLRGTTVTVLAATGPVGRRIVRLLAREGAQVRLGSRQMVHAEAACDRIAAQVPGADVTPVRTDSPETVAAATSGAQALIACGPPGIELLPEAGWKNAGLATIVDLNAAPPHGVGAVEPMDKGAERHGTRCFGALAVGALKMKIHKHALAKLFTANDLVLDAEEIFALGREVER